MAPEPTVTRYSFINPDDEITQIHLWSDDGVVWNVTDYYGQWLDAHGRWGWPPRTAPVEARAAWRMERIWDFGTALERARTAFEQTGARK